MNLPVLLRHIWAFFSVLVVLQGANARHDGLIKDILEDIGKAPELHGRDRSFFLVGRLSAVLEEMIYFSTNDGFLTSAEEEVRKHIKGCFDSASREMSEIVRWLRIEREGSAELIRDRWGEVDRCLAIAESLATRLHALDELVEAYRATKWTIAAPREAQYYDVGYCSEKLTRSIRLEALIRYFATHADPLRSDLLGIRKHTTERVLVATWLKVVAAGELDNFLRHELKTAGVIFPRVFQTELPRISEAVK